MATLEREDGTVKSGWFRGKSLCVCHKSSPGMTNVVQASELLRSAVTIRTDSFAQVPQRANRATGDATHVPRSPDISFECARRVSRNVTSTNRIASDWLE